MAQLSPEKLSHTVKEAKFKFERPQNYERPMVRKSIANWQGVMVVMSALCMFSGILLFGIVLGRFLWSK
jgi:polyferredoxin